MNNPKLWYRWFIGFALFSILAIVMAVVTRTWWLVPIDAACGTADVALAAWWRGKIPSAPSRHDLCLSSIDALERDLRVGRYEKTQAEFDAEVEAVVRPFRFLLRQLLQVWISHGRSGCPGSVTRGRTGLPRSWTSGADPWMLGYLVGVLVTCVSRTPFNGLPSEPPRPKRKRK